MWAAFGSLESGRSFGASLWPSVVFLAVLPAPLFMILAYLPSLIIAGVRMALIYFGDKENYFFRCGSVDRLDTFIITAADAVMTALFAFASFLLSRRHRY